MARSVYERSCAVVRKTVVIVLLALLPQPAMAFKSGLPGKPPPPPPPCISTSVLLAGNLVTCYARNAGAVDHMITIDIVNGNNNVVSECVQDTPAGLQNNCQVFPISFTTFFGCVVRTAEGTVDALNDLNVVMVAYPPQESGIFSPGVSSEGKVVQSCAAPVPLPPP